MQRKRIYLNKTSETILLESSGGGRITKHFRHATVCYLLLITYYLLLVTCYLLPIPNTHYPLPSNPYGSGSVEKGLQRKDVQSDK